MVEFGSENPRQTRLEYWIAVGANHERQDCSMCPRYGPAGIDENRQRLARQIAKAEPRQAE